MLRLAISRTGIERGVEPLDDISRQVLDAMQSGFPLKSDPYGVVAGQMGVPRQEVLDAVASMLADGTIRRLGASFASKKLGYSSTLCALAVPGPPQEVDRVAEIVSSYANVTHNYLRDNRFNLWFTVIARGSDEVARILDEISHRSGCGERLNLPATALYKIKVDFSEMPDSAASPGRGMRREAPSMGGFGQRAGVLHLPAATQAPFDPEAAFDVALVRWAQGNIAGPGVEVDREPFATAARILGDGLGGAPVDERQVLERLRSWKADGTIRRFGALVAHRRMGYAFNGMTVWDAPPDRADAVGRAFAREPFVSHCYARPRSPQWPYNLYAMVHAKTRIQLDERVAQLRRIAGLEPQVLVSTKEYKKSSMRYFEP